MNFPYKDNTENNTMWLKYLKNGVNGLKVKEKLKPILVFYVPVTLDLSKILGFF